MARSHRRSRILLRSSTASPPIARSDPGRLGGATSDQTKQGQAASLSVLLVEDEAVLLSHALSFLRAHGCRVDVAADGTTGLAMACRGSYDVVVLDLVLPDISGMAVLKLMRFGGALTPVVVLTSWPSVAWRHEAAALGVTEFRGKPIGAAELLAVVRAAAGIADATPSSELFRAPDGTASPRVIDLLQQLGAIDANLEIGQARIAISTAHPHLARQLALVMADKVTLFEYIAALGAFRTAQFDVPLLQFLDYLRRRFDDATRRGESVLDRALLERVARLEATGRNWRGPLSVRDAACTDSDASSPVNSAADGPVHLSVSALRSMVVIRQVIEQLIMSDEHVRQIAYGIGYEYESSMDRDFKKLLGVSPTTFRRLVRRFRS